MARPVKLNANQLNKLVTTLIHEEKNRLTKGSRPVKNSTISLIRRIVKEEMTRPDGVEYKSGSDKGPRIPVDDDKIDSLVNKLSGFDLNDEEIDMLVGKLKEK
jgi:hypothetical protein